MKLKLLSGLMLASFNSFAAAPINGLYAEVFGGYSYLPDNINTTLNGTSFSQVHYNSGYHGGGRFGYKDNPLRYEAEVIYISALPSQININQTQESNLSGQTNATAGLLNVYYDFPEFIPTLTPFLSGGIGYAYISSNITGSIKNISYQFRGTDNAFAYQHRQQFL